MVFRWIFIPWMQQELDAYKDCINNTRKCRDRNKVLPHGIPELVHTSPGDYGALDFKVMVQPAAVDHVREIYIKHAHPVFELVPPALGGFLEECYDALGRPPIDCKSAWGVYRALLSVIRQCAEIPAILESIDVNSIPDADVEVPLLD
ncbi:hypothetical protein PAXINDRAFT_158232, partial [Paxillus involutus ATCC 200175]